MASIVSQPNGRKSVQFAFNRKRPVVRLGVCTEKQATAFKVGLERLLDERAVGHPASPQTLAWLGSLTPKTRRRLADIGVLKNDPKNRLDDFLAFVFERLNVKSSTMTGYSQSRRNLLEFFGPEKPIDEITEGDAEDFRAWLRTQNKLREDGVMADTTVSKRCQRAREFFDTAVKHRWVPTNPFGEMKGWKTSNPDRMEFISRETIARVMRHCDPEWRLILALCRYGGLRCPSEVTGLTWQDIDWEAGIMHVRSPKTTRYVGKGQRDVPIFAELRQYLLDASELAPPGTVYVIYGRQRSGQALRSQLEKILRRAGIPQWGKLFQNLRSTRETELLEEFPMQVVCAWIGNTPDVALRHYLQVTKDHIAKAVNGVDEKALQKAQHLAVHEPETPSKSGAQSRATKTPP